MRRARRAGSWAVGLVVAAAVLLLLPGRAAAEVRRYVVAIGNNEPPPTRSGEDEKLATLRYADDDAASIAALGGEIGATTTLLTVFDADSRRRFAGLVEGARPPALAELRRVVEGLRAELEADVHRGDEPVLVLFYSGHGVAGVDATCCTTRSSLACPRATCTSSSTPATPRQWCGRATRRPKWPK
jgi:hypothetical protein